MLRILCTNIVRFSSQTQLGFPEKSIYFRSLSVSPLKQEQSLARVSDYLISSCGLSPEEAKSVSRRINLENLDNANAVISLVKDYGLTNRDISKMVTKCPRLLLSNPNDTLMPKLQFLKSVEASSSDLCMLLTVNPLLLIRGLDTWIVPLYNTLKSVLESNVKVFTCMKRLPWVGKTFLMNLDCRLGYLRELGMPSRSITSLLLHFPQVFGAPSHKFNQAVKKVIGIGCDPTKPAFVSAIKVIVDTSHETRKAKFELYRKYGFSENEIWSIFKEHPLILKPSVENIKSIMDFFVSKMGLQPAYIARHLVVLTYSLHNRVIPRCSVIRVLHLKGLLPKKIAIPTVLAMSEKQFLDTFVMKYPKDAPQLLSILQRKQSIQELGFDFEEKTSPESS